MKPYRLPKAGLIIVTGTPGSGKTSWILQHLDLENRAQDVAYSFSVEDFYRGQALPTSFLHDRLYFIEISDIRHIPPIIQKQAKTIVITCKHTDGSLNATFVKNAEFPALPEVISTDSYFRVFKNINPPKQPVIAPLNLATCVENLAYLQMLQTMEDSTLNRKSGVN